MYPTIPMPGLKGFGATVVHDPVKPEVNRPQGEHVPPRQDSPVPQRLPHEPQLLLSVKRFTSHPSDAMPLQLANPELQEPTMHPPPTHPSMATFARAHTLVQPLQLFGSVCVLTHTPPQLVNG
jgi:hypothetical protein